MHSVTSFSRIGVGARFPSSVQFWTQRTEDIRVTSEIFGYTSSFVCYAFYLTGEWGGVKSSSRNEQLSIRKVSSVCSCLCIVAWMACEEKRDDVRYVRDAIICDVTWRKRKAHLNPISLFFLRPGKNENNTH